MVQQMRVLKHSRLGSGKEKENISRDKENISRDKEIQTKLPCAECGRKEGTLSRRWRELISLQESLTETFR